MFISAFPSRKMFIGVDVGGTNTDAVVISSSEVLSWCKTITTNPDITEGVRLAVQGALAKLPLEGREKISRISIGTTHFLNAVLQGKDLAKVSVVRLCGSASVALPPFVDITEELKSLIQGDVFLVQGGYYVDGKTFAEVDEEEIIRVVKQIQSSDVRNVVVSGIYSPINPDQEMRVAAILSDRIPDISITMSHTIGHMGLLERENAAILNECLKPLCQETLLGLHRAVGDLGLNCPLFLTQNDGTLVSLETCLSFPVCTFASGATNSMRGAAFLAAKFGGEKNPLKDAIVVDIGGTTSDVGQLVNGFPRTAPSKVEIAGVFTNFRMPHLVSIALGGGSIIRTSEDNTCIEAIGPLSVGCRLLEEAQCAGGDTLTATDVAVKSGIFDGLGNPERVCVSEELAKVALNKIREKVEAAVDKIMVSAQPLPLIIVGGGAILLDSSRAMKGVSELIFPKNYQVANAIGAALAQVSGTVDLVIADTPRSAAVAEAKNKAVEKAVATGALRDTVEIVEISEVPLSYLPGNTVRYFVKAVGELDPERSDKIADKLPSVITGKPPATAKAEPRKVSGSAHPNRTSPKFGQFPYCNGTSEEWLLDEYDLEAVAIGAGVLGCGGGGTPYLAELAAKQCLKEGKILKIVKESSLGEDCWVTPLCFMGAPTVSIEKLKNRTTGPAAIRELENICNIKSDAVITFEIGGSNSISPLVAAADLNLPMVDADGMGRAFPELQMCTPIMFGYSPTPATLVDEKGLCLAVKNCQSGKSLEDIFRCNVVNFMGCSAAVAFNPLKPSEIRSKCVLGSFSRAWSLGHAVLEAKVKKENHVEAILRHDNSSRLLIEGKIIDVSRRTTGGFARGSLIVKSFVGEFEVRVDFQNENLIATKISSSGGETVLATTPNLIVLLEMESGLALQTEELKFGLRVSVIVLVAPEILLSEQALQFVGPKAFGYDIELVV